MTRKWYLEIFNIGVLNSWINYYSSFHVVTIGENFSLSPNPTSGTVTVTYRGISREILRLIIGNCTPTSHVWWMCDVV